MAPRGCRAARRRHRLRFRLTLSILLTRVLRVSSRWPHHKNPVSLVNAQMPVKEMKNEGQGDSSRVTRWTIEVQHLSPESQKAIQFYLGDVATLTFFCSPFKKLVLPRSIFWAADVPQAARKFAWSNPISAEGVEPEQISKLIYVDGHDHQLSFLSRGGMVFWDRDAKIIAVNAFKDPPPIPDPMLGLWYGKPYLARDFEKKIEVDRWQKVIDQEKYPGATEHAWIVPGEDDLQYGGEAFRFAEAPTVVFPILEEESPTFPNSLVGCDLVEVYLDTSHMNFKNVENYLAGNEPGKVETDFAYLEPATKALMLFQRRNEEEKLRQRRSLFQYISPPDMVIRTARGMLVSTYYMMLPEYQKKYRNDFVAHKTGKSMEYMAYVYPADLDPPLMSPPQALNLKVDVLKQQLFFAEGGFLFWGNYDTSGSDPKKHGRLLKAYTMVFNNNGHIHFGAPIKFSALPGIKQVSEKRFRQVPFPAIRAKGGRKYAWVTAADKVGSFSVFSGSMQGFAFKFDDEKDNVFFPIESGTDLGTWLKLGAILFVGLLFLGALFVVGHRFIIRNRAKREEEEKKGKKAQLLIEQPSKAELTKRKTIAETRQSLFVLQKEGATNASPKSAAASAPVD